MVQELAVVLLTTLELVQLEGRWGKHSRTVMISNLKHRRAMNKRIQFVVRSIFHCLSLVCLFYIGVFRLSLLESLWPERCGMRRAMW